MNPESHPRRHSPLFFTEPGLFEDGRVFIEGPEAGHLATSRRARPGEVISVSDGAGRIAEARLQSVHLARCDAEIVSETVLERPRPHLAVFQALTKRHKLDGVIEALGSMGVAAVTVFESERSVPDWDEAKAVRELERWRARAREGAKVARIPWIPEVDGPIGGQEAIRRAGRWAPVLVAHEDAAVPLRERLAPEAPERTALVIGPEGGLGREEAAGFGPDLVSLGRPVFRTESAAVIAVAMVAFHYGILG